MAPTGGMVSYLGKLYRMQSVVKAAAASATVEVVAAVSGRAIRLMGFLVSNDSSTAGSFTLKSGTTAISPVLRLAGNGSSYVAQALDGNGVAQTAVGEALNVSAVTTGIDGLFYYVVLDPAHSSTAYVGG